MTSTVGNRMRIRSIAKWASGVVVCVVSLLPIWWMVNVVFSSGGQALSITPQLYPSSLSGGVANVSQLLGDTTFVHSFVNSLVYSVSTVVVVLVVASLAAYEFSSYEFPGKRFIYSACLVGLMVPLAVVVVPASRIVAQLGWLNSLQGIVLPSSASAFALFLLTEYMRSVPRELFEAARVDGASHFGIYWRIVVPVTRNGMLTVGILTFVTSWASFLWPLVVATDPGSYPVSVAVAGYFEIGSKYPTNIVLTAAFLSAVPVIAFYVFFNRFIVDGLSRSGLSG